MEKTFNPWLAADFWQLFYSKNTHPFILEILKMFFPWYKFCFDSESDSCSTWRQRRLQFLKSMRDDLETRLAAINAAIETIERQNRQEES